MTAKPELSPENPETEGERDPSPASAQLETLSEAIARLARAGFRDSFQARGDCLVSLETARQLAPEELVVSEVVRFEGDSDPGDMTVLFALRSADGSLRGTFVAGYGTTADAESARIVAHLEAEHGGTTRARERARAETEAAHKRDAGRVGWILLWLIGVPIPLLLALYVLRGCT